MKAGRVALITAAVLTAPLVPALAQADTVPPAGVVEREITFPSGALKLTGTVTEPEGAVRTPIAVIIAGSGPTDRNGNARMGLRTNTYAQLAWGLAKQGISSFRYDKRVLPTRTGTVDFARLTFDDFVTDVGAAVEAVRGSAYSTMVLIGHSEGGNLAIQAVVQGLAVDGLVLLSTPGRPITALLHEQIGRQVPDSTLVQFDSALARYLRGEPTGEVLPGLRSLLLPVNQRFMQTAAAFDPAAALGRVRVPTLIVQGETDIQVRVMDAEALKAARPDAELVLLPGTNHVLKAATDTLMGTQVPTYLNVALPVVPAAVEAVRSFVSRLPAR